MKVLYDLEDMIEDEIKKITKKGELDVQSVELAYKMVDIYKDIETICAMKSSNSGGYSRSDGSWSGGSYGMGRIYDDGYAMRRDSMGRYSRSGYARNEEHDHAIQRLEQMLKDTTDENVRRSIQKSINDLKE